MSAVDRLTAEASLLIEEGADPARVASAMIVLGIQGLSAIDRAAVEELLTGALAKVRAGFYDGRNAPQRPN